VKKVISILLLAIAASQIFAQNEIYFSGKVVKGATPIYNATIFNVTSSKGAVSDYEGNFSFFASINDTIKISSIGFKLVEFVIPDTIQDKKFRVLVNMVEDTVLLKEAVVMPWPSSRSMLKRAMLDVESEKEQITSYAGFRTNDRPAREPAPTLANPISLLFNKFSKKERQRKKIEKYRRIIDEGPSYREQEEIRY
jgi:hypothetical protein